MDNERSLAKEITEGFEALKSMRNNEPVAWMMKAREPSLHCPDYVTFEKPTRDMKISHHPYPLYTHPAKTLTDEEILEIWNQHSKYGAVISVYDFAKAILRKAQEK